jgi:S1-C subfamily serine protease
MIKIIRVFLNCILSLILISAAAPTLFADNSVTYSGVAQSDNDTVCDYDNKKFLLTKYTDRFVLKFTYYDQFPASKGEIKNGSIESKIGLRVNVNSGDLIERATLKGKFSNENFEGLIRGQFSYMEEHREETELCTISLVASLVDPRPDPANSRLANEAKLQIAEANRKQEDAERRLAELEAKEAARKSAEAKPEPKPTPQVSASTSGSGFFVSKSGHVITNQHVVADCKKVTVGDKVDKQVQADVLEKDARNDLALLKISSLKMASSETQSLIQKLGLTLVPLASDGLLRSDDLDLGEDVLVAGYPNGEIFGDAIKVTKGIVSSNRGMGDDITQFQIDAAVQPGFSGGPIYDQKGNIVGVVVSQLNRLKFAKMVGSMPENVNFGIKASTVRQFLSSSGLPSKWATRSKRISTRDLAKIAKNQAVMVVCQK